MNTTWKHSPSYLGGQKSQIIEPFYRRGFYRAAR